MQASKTSRIEYEMADSIFVTPGGNTAKMHYRLETNDWNTINSVMAADEYHLKSFMPLSGMALDIGAHIGSVGIALVLDNPSLHVVCVEPVPENVDLIRMNIKENNLTARIEVLQMGAAGPDIETTKIRWRYRGSENADHHAFIGNATIVEGLGITDAEYEEETVQCIAISELIQPFGRINFLKIDCEGCEWSALIDPAVEHIPVIVGEWHPVNGKSQDDLIRLLAASHYVTFEGPEEGPGGFKAVLA